MRQPKSKELTNVCSSTVAPVITILKFFKRNAIIVKKGSAIDIPAEVRGLPLPTLQWMKDDVVIEKPDGEKMTMETEEVRAHSCVHGFHSFIMSNNLLQRLMSSHISVGGSKIH